MLVFYSLLYFFFIFQFCYFGKRPVLRAVTFSGSLPYSPICNFFSCFNGHQIVVVAQWSYKFYSGPVHVTVKSTVKAQVPKWSGCDSVWRSQNVVGSAASITSRPRRANMYASLVATRRTRSDGKHAAGRPASKWLSLPLPGPTSSARDGPQPCPARDGPRPGRCLGSADALITAHIVDEGIRFRQVPARRSPATFGESAKASVGHLSPGHLTQKSQSRASAPPLTITLTVITPTTTLNSYPITGRACTDGCDFILFYLHRLLLLFTFIVFVPVHVLLTLYLEYDL